MASISDVQTTFSSWDSCMSKDYCKWPVVVGIIIGSLVLLSVLFCIARCLCFGAECCACCFSCLSCCCPGRKRQNRGGYENFRPPPPFPYQQQYPQYHSPAAPMYGPQFATFETPSKSPATARYNEDALPAMPSWDTSATRRVEEEPVEMDRLGNAQYQQQHLLAGQEQRAGEQNQYPPNGQYAQASQQRYTQAGPYDNDHDLSHGYGGRSNTTTTPYHDYSAAQQYAPSLSPVSSTAYAPSSTIPPSYRTHAPSEIVSPIQTSYNPFPARRPVQGSWRNV